MTRHSIRKRLIRLQGRRCCYCRCPLTRFRLALGPRPTDATIEHVWPRGLGGGDDPANQAVACRHCNWSKGELSVEEFLARRRRA